MSDLDLVVIHEHPEWQRPLFSALDRRGLRYGVFDLKRAAFEVGVKPAARLYFNQASPSAYVRGNTRAVPLALAFMRALEVQGVRVLNGSRAFAFELSKTHQAALLTELGIRTPRTLVFNDVEAVTALAAGFPFPALLKPEQGGSGARMYLVESVDDLARLLHLQPDLWQPDNLLLLQELVPYDRAHGIVRLELLGGELLYAMRVVSHGRFNLCPSEVCNPADGAEGACEVQLVAPAPPVEFHPYPEVAPEVVDAAKKIARAGSLDVAGIECILTPDGPVFYDVNANSNLRLPIGQAFGFDPFERVVDFLERTLASLSPAP